MAEIIKVSEIKVGDTLDISYGGVVSLVEATGIKVRGKEISKFRISNIKKDSDETLERSSNGVAIRISSVTKAGEIVYA